MHKVNPLVCLDSIIEEEAKYLDQDMTNFLAKGQRSNQDSKNLRQGNQDQNYYRDKYRDQSTDRWWLEVKR